MPCDCALHARLRLPVMLIIHIIHRHSSRRLLHVVPSSLKSLTSAKAAKSSTEAFIVAEKSIVLERSANWCLIMFNHKALPQSEDFQTARSYWISGVAPVLAKKPRWQPLAQRLSTWKKRTLQHTPQDVCESLAKVKKSGELCCWSCCLVCNVMSCFKSLSSKHLQAFLPEAHFQEPSNDWNGSSFHSRLDIGTKLVTCLLHQKRRFPALPCAPGSRRFLCRKNMKKRRKRSPLSFKQIVCSWGGPKVCRV